MINDEVFLIIKEIDKNLNHVVKMGEDIEVGIFNVSNYSETLTTLGKA